MDNKEEAYFGEHGEYWREERPAMTKHTPDFREQIAIHIEMLLDDEMRAHAYADKTHDLEFQVFRVLGGYREALDAIKSKDSRIAELEADLADVTDYTDELVETINTLYEKLGSIPHDLAVEREKVELLREAFKKDHRDSVYHATDPGIFGEKQEEAMWAEHHRYNPNCPACEALAATESKV